MGNPSLGQMLATVYQRLMARYGPQHWWPAEEPFEVIVGAILTQSAAWVNVEKAIATTAALLGSYPYINRPLWPVSLRTIALSLSFNTWLESTSRREAPTQG